MTSVPVVKLNMETDDFYNANTDGRTTKDKVKMCFRDTASKAGILP